MVLGNADLSSGQATPREHAAADSTRNLAVMGNTGFVATQEIDQLAQLAQTVPDIAEALENSTMDGNNMFNKVLEQLRAAEAQQLSQGLTQVKTFVDTNKRAEELKTFQAELGLAKAQQDTKDIEDLLKVGMPRPESLDPLKRIIKESIAAGESRSFGSREIYIHRPTPMPLHQAAHVRPS